jgi:hypothetical protein
MIYKKPGSESLNYEKPVGGQKQEVRRRKEKQVVNFLLNNA